MSRASAVLSRASITAAAESAPARAATSIRRGARQRGVMLGRVEQQGRQPLGAEFSQSFGG
jgi:hypothetical protein